MSLCEQHTAATGKFDRALHVPENDAAAPGLPRVMEPTSPQAQIPSAHGFPRRLTEPWVRALSLPRAEFGEPRGAVPPLAETGG